MAKTPGLEAHGGHEHGIPEVPFGSIEQPISFGASADGTSSVTSARGRGSEAVDVRDPEYVHRTAWAPRTRRSWPAATWSERAAGVWTSHDLFTYYLPSYGGFAVNVGENRQVYAFAHCT